MYNVEILCTIKFHKILNVHVTYTHTHTNTLTVLLTHTLTLSHTHLLYSKTSIYCKYYVGA